MASCFIQLLSVEDVEKILDDTAEAVEYQKVRFFHWCD